MEIENINLQDKHERLFTDFLARQPLTSERQFTFNIDAYRAQYPESAQQVINNPSKYYVIIKKFLQKRVNDENSKLKTDSKVERFDIKIEGNLGANFVTPRGLNSRMANQLVGIQGIITKMQISQNYLEKSVHYCAKTKTIEQRQYPDSFNPEKDGDLNRARAIITHDDKGNPLQFQYGLSSFKNTQIVVIQQLPQMAPPGLLPMSVQVVLQNNLVNSVKPGDRVQIIGIYKLISGMVTKQKGIFRPYFICLSIKPLNNVLYSNKRLQKLQYPKQQMFDLFSRSIAPSVWGHHELKKAVLLMLLGGVQKCLENGTHLRGDINLLMVGDPGTAKSQILRWVLSTVDVSVGTTGSGASGVGLTAAIVSDKLTGEKTLQAGAMVLADRGVVCIDEFDKMNDNDRVAVHEVMQQQTVTIAKAGLHCSLNARCSVIAAANPLYGEYLKTLDPTRNVGMPDSLLSRFDLIFIILDEKTKERDIQIAEKVCRNHRLAPQVNDFLNQYMDAEEYVVNPVEDKQVEEGVFEKNNVYRGEGKDQILTQYYLKKYINYVKQNCVPDLSDSAVDLGASLWNLLRQYDFNQKEARMKVLPVTIRTHQSLIRLATAHAKLHQSPYVEVPDMIEAYKLIAHCLQIQETDSFEAISNILQELKISYDLRNSFKNLTYTNKRETEYKKQEIKKMQPEEEIKMKMKKLNMRQNEKQADEVLEKHSAKEDPIPTNEITLVYKKASDLKKRLKGNQTELHIDKLFEDVKSVIKSKEKLKLILIHLENNNKLSLEDDGKIYFV